MGNFRKLGRHAAHRVSMLRRMVSQLVKHERIETTVAKDLQDYCQFGVMMLQGVGFLLYMNPHRHVFFLQTKVQYIHFERQKVPD